MNGLALGTLCFLFQPLGGQARLADLDGRGRAGSRGRAQKIKKLKIHPRAPLPPESYDLGNEPIELAKNLHVGRMRHFKNFFPLPLFKLRIFCCPFLAFLVFHKEQFL